jgi:hypothetical protein
MAKKVFELTINSRPDASGKIWAMIQDRQGEHYAGHIARYVESNSGGRIKAAFEARCFVGVVSDSITSLVHAVSEWCTGNPYSAQFIRADRMGYIDAAAGVVANDVGPVLYFWIDSGENDSEIPSNTEEV